MRHALRQWCSPGRRCCWPSRSWSPRSRSTAADWEPPALVALLLGLALATDLFAVSHGGQRISGSFLALVLADGAARPGAGDGDRHRRRCSSTTCARATRCRCCSPTSRRSPRSRCVGGLLIDCGRRRRRSRPRFPLLVFGVFMVTNLLNFLMIGGHHAFADARRRWPASSARSSCRCCRRRCSARCCARSSPPFYVRTGRGRDRADAARAADVPVPAARAAALARAGRAARRRCSSACWSR